MPDPAAPACAGRSASRDPQRLKSNDGDGVAGRAGGSLTVTEAGTLAVPSYAHRPKTAATVKRLSAPQSSKALDLCPAFARLRNDGSWTLMPSPERTITAPQPLQ